MIQTDESSDAKTIVAEAQFDLAKHLGDSEEISELKLPFTKLNCLTALCSLSVKKLPKLNPSTQRHVTGESKREDETPLRIKKAPTLKIE